MEARDSFCFPKNTKNPNPSPIGKKFRFCCCGAMEGTRTPGLLIRSQSLYPAELPTHTFRSEHDVFYHVRGVLSTSFWNYFCVFWKRVSFIRFCAWFSFISSVPELLFPRKTPPCTLRLAPGLLQFSAGKSACAAASAEKLFRMRQISIFYDFSGIAFTFLVL